MNQRRSVLIIEDDHQTRVSLRSVLEDNSYEVFSATNGANALVLMRVLDPTDFIVLDINMPIMNGDEFLEAAKHHQRWSSVPIIQISAANNPKRPEVQYALQKPFELSELLKLLSSKS